MTVDQSTFGGQEVPHDLVELGHVMSAFGVRGWIKIRPYTDGFDTLVQAKQWWLKAPESVLAQGAAPFVPLPIAQARPQDRKSTRLNSSHVAISYAVFCLKKKKTRT